jgi:fructokinase
MMMENAEELSLHERRIRFDQPGSIVVLGEVLWDIFPDSSRLGGAPLNFAAHAKRLGYQPILISAVGTDELGVEATRRITNLGLDASLLGCSKVFKTGTASVEIDRDGEPSFAIQRPAAYDDVRLTAEDILRIKRLNPGWLYYGTLYPSLPQPRVTLQQLFDALPGAIRFYDVNLRPGFDDPALVSELAARADVIKLNESEALAVGASLGLPASVEEFCRRGAGRFGWSAVCITLGERGCAMFDGSEFVLAEGHSVQVVDTVGAGDAFAAAFMHGLIQRWPLGETAGFANRVGALVASRAGAIPEWSLADASMLL